MADGDRAQLAEYFKKFYALPAGRYIANAGARPAKYWGNCYALRAEEDTREEWANLTERVMLCLMTGGGIGVDYSRLRPSGHRLYRTGGISSGPVPLMLGINDMSRQIRQGGNRRAACWAGLNWQHEDIQSFIHAKDWSELVTYCKDRDPDFPAPLDQTNISILWDDHLWQSSYQTEEENRFPDIWYQTVQHMCETGEPGFSFNFGDHSNETLRNACTEFTSEDDSDVCNLASINMGAIDTLDEFRAAVHLTSKFLVCGSLRGEVPYPKVADVRKRNRKIGLGIMGLHEWLLKRGYKYEFNDELKEWMNVYREESESAAKTHAERFYIAPPKAYRAIAPTGTTAILAGTTSGIEPLYATAYRRRHVGENNRWREQFVIEAVAERLIRNYGIDPDEIETSLTIASDPERRIRMQYELQKFVDMGISSTVNLPAWGSDDNNPDRAKDFANILGRYCSGLRGITCYPNGSRGNQPLSPVPYEEAKAKRDSIVEATEDNCISGVCGV
jgi:ribonucleoside-diphosphate reductase alpha chain